MKPHYFPKNRFAIRVASLVFEQGIKCAIFENMSTTVNIESLPLCFLGNPRTKSILATSQGFFGMGSG